MPDPDRNASAVGIGVVVAIGALLMAWLSIDGLVSGETVNIGKYRHGVPLSGVKGAGVAISYGAFALGLALFAVACFNSTSAAQARLLSWAKRVVIVAGLMLLFFALFIK